MDINNIRIIRRGPRRLIPRRLHVGIKLLLLLEPGRIDQAEWIQQEHEGHGADTGDGQPLRLGEELPLILLAIPGRIHFGFVLAFTD